MHPATARLPGVQPATQGDWLRVDDAFSVQMALRDRLIAQIPDTVHALLPQAEQAAQELLRFVAQESAHAPGYQIDQDQIIRPDGQRVSLDRNTPLLTLGCLVQEDFALHP